MITGDGIFMTLEEKLKTDLNDAQYTAATHMDGPAVIMAGAGSGKTHTLISRVSYLISKGVAPENILMLTFTNAAAREMKARASQLLDERCSRITAFSRGAASPTTSCWRWSRPTPRSPRRNDARSRKNI